MFIRVSLGKLLVNLLQVVERTNTPLIPEHDPKTHGLSTRPFLKLLGWGQRLSPASLPVEQVLGEYSLS